MKHLCRCCDSELPISPILYYENMPKSAQYFPTNDNVVTEKGVDLSVFQCQYCGLIQLTDEPVLYFRDVIRATGVSQEMTKFREKQFNNFVKDHQLQGKKIIEIGSGCGEFMQMMNSTGVNVFGLEHLPSSLEEAQKNNLAVYQGYITDRSYPIPGGPYDAFYIMNFLEHIPEPREFLKGIFHNLSEIAVGIVEVPNVNMILEKQLFSEFISDHLMYFTKGTLTSMLENNGFEVLDCKEIWYDYIISATVRKKRLINVENLCRQQDKIANEINIYIKEQNRKNRKVAIWGAGHQALSVMALAKIEGRIECVIDSAVFKQNKFTPATHIPTKAPDVLGMGAIKAVLIMAAGYSDEIACIIEKQYPTISIAVLRDYGIEVIKE